MWHLRSWACIFLNNVFWKISKIHVKFVVFLVLRVEFESHLIRKYLTSDYEQSTFPYCVQHVCVLSALKLNLLKSCCHFSQRLFWLVSLFLAKLWTKWCYRSYTNIMPMYAASFIPAWPSNSATSKATIFGFVQVLDDKNEWEADG